MNELCIEKGGRLLSHALCVGETCRRVLPSKFFSKDRHAAVEVRDTMLGERVEEFGVMKKRTPQPSILKGEFSTHTIQVLFDEVSDEHQ